MKEKKLTEFRRKRNELQRVLAFERAARCGRPARRADFAAAGELVDKVLAWKAKNPTPGQVEKGKKSKETREQLGRAMALLRRFDRGRTDLFDLRSEYQKLEREVLGVNIPANPMPPAMEARMARMFGKPATLQQSGEVKWMKLPVGESAFRLIPPENAVDIDHRRFHFINDEKPPFSWWMVTSIDGKSCRVLARGCNEAANLGTEKLGEPRFVCVVDKL